MCYTDTDSFVAHIKTEDFIEDISNDVERWFDTSNYDENGKRLRPIGTIITEVLPLRAKTYAYLIYDYGDGDDVDYQKHEIINKKAKGTKKCIIKRRLMFENYKDCLINDKTILRSQKRFKSYHHKMYTEEVNKIALSSDDNKRLQKYDRVTTYPYGTTNGMLEVLETKEILKI